MAKGDTYKVNGWTLYEGISTAADIAWAKAHEHERVYGAYGANIEKDPNVEAKAGWNAGLTSTDFKEKATGSQLGAASITNPYNWTFGGYTDAQGNKVTPGSQIDLSNISGGAFGPSGGGGWRPVAIAAQNLLWRGKAGDRPWETWGMTKKEYDQMTGGIGPAGASAAVGPYTVKTPTITNQTDPYANSPWKTMGMTKKEYEMMVGPVIPSAQQIAANRQNQLLTQKGLEQGPEILPTPLQDERRESILASRGPNVPIAGAGTAPGAALASAQGFTPPLNQHMSLAGLPAVAGWRGGRQEGTQDRAGVTPTPSATRGLEDLGRILGGVGSTVWRSFWDRGIVNAWNAASATIGPMIGAASPTQPIVSKLLDERQEAIAANRAITRGRTPQERALGANLRTLHPQYAKPPLPDERQEAIEAYRAATSKVASGQRTTPQDDAWLRLRASLEGNKPISAQDAAWLQANAPAWFNEMIKAGWQITYDANGVPTGYAPPVTIPGLNGIGGAGWGYGGGGGGGGGGGWSGGGDTGGRAPWTYGAVLWRI